MLRVAALIRENKPAAVLAGWTILWFSAMAAHGGASWHFFVQGATTLADLDATRGGLHLYAVAPMLQIGPLAFLATLAVLPAGPVPGLLAGQVLGAASGLFILWQIRRIALDAYPGLDRTALTRRVAITGIAFMPAWMYLAVASVHIDDVLALLFAVLALRFALAHRPVVTGLLLGAAVDAKPWAVIFAGLLLLAGDRRAVLRGAVALAAAVALAWLPFFLADPATMSAAHYTIPNTQGSALRVLGVQDLRTPPWDRPVQGLVGLGLSALAVVRRRWAAALLIAVAARITLDPGTNWYYIAGLVVGAAVWDVIGSRSRFPWWTVIAYVGLFAIRWIPIPPPVHGWLTLAYFLACCVLVCRPHRRPDRCRSPA
jgi:hypothetical protein